VTPERPVTPDQPDPPVTPDPTSTADRPQPRWPIQSWTFPPGHGVPTPIAPFAHATAAGPLLFVTGQMPIDPETGALVPGGIKEQTDQVLANLTRVLELAGSGRDHVVQARAYLTDMALYDDFNNTYRAWFPDRLPSRTCIAVTGLALGALVEIDLVATLASLVVDVPETNDP
jgi:reactive intermediate/imine deaminase